MLCIHWLSMCPKHIPAHQSGSSIQDPISSSRKARATPKNNWKTEQNLLVQNSSKENVRA